ncbi:MAG: hypothetical protein ACI4VQ_03090, partial [Clostridia bacterium]
LNYLILNTIDRDKESEIKNEEKQQEIQDIIISKMLEKVITMNNDISEKELQDIVGEKFAIIKYKNQASLQEIQQIFSKHIDKYLSKINS